MDDLVIDTAEARNIIKQIQNNGHNLNDQIVMVERILEIMKGQVMIMLSDAKLIDNKIKPFLRNGGLWEEDKDGK